MRAGLLVSLMVSLTIGGCNRAELIEKLTPAADETFARERFDLLRQKQFERIERELDPSISDPNIQDTLETMAEVFPAEEPKSVKVVGVRFLNSPDSSTHSLALEYESRKNGS